MTLMLLKDVNVSSASVGEWLVLLWVQNCYCRPTVLPGQPHLPRACCHTSEGTRQLALVRTFFDLLHFTALQDPGCYCPGLMAQGFNWLIKDTDLDAKVTYSDRMSSPARNCSCVHTTPQRVLASGDECMQSSHVPMTVDVAAEGTLNIYRQILN